MAVPVRGLHLYPSRWNDPYGAKFASDRDKINAIGNLNSVKITLFSYMNHYEQGPVPSYALYAELRTDIMDRRAIVAIGLFGLLLMLQPLLLSGSVDAIVIGAPIRVQRILERPRWQPLLYVLRVLLWASPFLALFALNLMIPFRYILPQLGG